MLFRSIHDPQVNAEIANTIHYAAANKAAKEFNDAEDLANPAIYPPAEVVAKSEALVDVEDFTPVYDRAWPEVQAARSEERRDGQEGVRPWSSRWGPDHSKKKQQN